MTIICNLDKSYRELKFNPSDSAVQYHTRFESQFDMNSNIEEISSNTGVLPKHEIVCISYKHVHL